jgi:hypothetical protein
MPQHLLPPRSLLSPCLLPQTTLLPCWCGPCLAHPCAGKVAAILQSWLIFAQKVWLLPRLTNASILFTRKYVLVCIRWLNFLVLNSSYLTRCIGNLCHPAFSPWQNKSHRPLPLLSRIRRKAIHVFSNSFAWCYGVWEFSTAYTYTKSRNGLA